MNLFQFLFPSKKVEKRQIYLDSAATTVIDPAVLLVMNNVYKNQYYNAASLHTLGTSTDQVIQKCRSKIQKLIHSQDHDIVFTSGGTESCNIAIRSIVLSYRQKHRDLIPHVIISAIEHSAVIQTVMNLEALGLCTFDTAPVDGFGFVSSLQILSMIKSETVLVAVQYVNNEIGTVQPIRELVRKVKQYRREKDAAYPYIFCDAVQAGYVMDIHMQSLDVDMLALSGSKIYGPKSSGMLAVRRRLQIHAVQSGGDLQFGLRAGTYDIASIVGFAKALELANENRGITVENILRLKSLLLVSLHQLQDQYSDKIIINTPELSSPHILHFSLAGVDSDYVVLYFDAADIAIASGSACNTSNGQISHVIRALWISRGDSNYGQFAHIRISLGQYTTDLDIQAFITRFKQLLIQTSKNSK